MARYIDAEQVIRWIEHDALSQVYYSKSDAIDCVKATPTADVVQVVRCKDCKYFISGVCRHDLAMNLSRDDDFCSYGERRKEDDKIY